MYRPKEENKSMGFKKALIIMGTLSVLTFPAQLYGTKKDIEQMTIEEQQYQTNAVNSKVYQDKAQQQEIELNKLRQALTESEKKLASRGEEDRNRQAVIQAIDKQMDGVLKHTGIWFYNSGKKYKVNPMMLAAIAIHESREKDKNGNWIVGTSYAIKNYNNPSGINQRKGFPHDGRYTVYPTLEAGIEDFAKLIKEYYIDYRKLNSIDTIGPVYCPTDDPANHTMGMNNEGWVPAVTQWYTKIYNEYTKLNGGN